MALDRIPGDASLYIGGYVFVQVPRGLARLSSLSLSFSRPSDVGHSRILHSLSLLCCASMALSEARRGNETLRLM